MTTWIKEPIHDVQTGVLLDPGTVRCRCGAAHDLAFHDDSACDECGRAYNASGQELAPRLQWEEA